jgi:hypothetical protein
MKQHLVLSILKIEFYFTFFILSKPLGNCQKVNKDIDQRIKIGWMKWKYLLRVLCGREVVVEENEKKTK